MSCAPTCKLNDGRLIPQLGLGVWQMADDEAGPLVAQAIAACYRLIDTAAIYGNERGVGEGIRRAEAQMVGREEVFLTSKVWNDRQGYDNALSAFERSLGRLKQDYVDLYLIHWPAPARGLYVETWKALIRLKEEGRARSIGVSNFMPEHLERIIGETGVAPAVNQIELHPRLQQRTLRDVHKRHGIQTEAWSPLGQGQLLTDPLIGKIAAKVGHTPAQVILRWHMQNSVVAIPKSASPERMAQNIDVFGFELSDDDMSIIAGLDSAMGRIGFDPLTFS
ncbi:MAG TPA: aldo/keto reductase [Caulobacteraceae bacterium]|nr:aldo/keto reductase [Caulobacteraceae bacterium]